MLYASTACNFIQLTTASILYFNTKMQTAYIRYLYEDWKNTKSLQKPKQLHTV